ncbi:MAG: SRPBCC family protein [Conexibacter sp.]
MIEFTIETEIARPAAEVFAYVTDPTKLSTWQTNTVSAVPEGEGPIGVGTRLREVHRGPGGRELASVVEVSEYEPDRAFALRMVEGPLPIHARIAFEPTERGTRMRFTGHGQLRGPLRLVQPLLAHTLKRQFANHCATLKRVLEDGPC